MDIQTVKSEFDALGAKINSKLEEVNDKVAKGEKVTNELKSEVDKLAGDYADKLKSLEESSEAKQKQLDELDIKLQERAKHSEKKDFETYVQDQIKETKSFKDNNRFKNVSLDYQSKADLLATTGGSVLSGRVIGYDLQPGVVDPLERTQHIRNYMNVSPTNSNTVSWIEENAFNDSTDSKAEGVAVDESDFTFIERSAVVEKMGAYMNASREILEDIPYLSNYIRTRLFQKLRQYEDLQILYGTGSNNEFSGLTGTAKAWSSAAIEPYADGNANNWDVLRVACQIAHVDEYMPTLALVNPVTLAEMDLTKDADGRYLLPNIFSGAQHQVGGVPVIASTAVTAGDFVVGDFGLGATLFDRRQAQIEIADQDDTDFIKDMIKIKITQRAVLAKHRPTVFIYGDFSTALTALNS